jgi:hypothetical protein
MNEDFFPISKDTDVKCYRCKKENTQSEEQFYLTEWELSTGASTDGIYYCHSCIINSGEHTMITLLEPKNPKSDKKDKNVPVTVFTLTFATIDLNYSNVSISKKVPNSRLELNESVLNDHFDDIIRDYNDPSISTIKGVFNGKYVNVEKKYISGFFVDVLHKVEGEACNGFDNDGLPPWNP